MDSQQQQDNRNERLSSYDTKELQKEMQHIIDGDIAKKTNKSDDSLDYKQINDKLKTMDLPDEQDRKRIVGCLAAVLAYTFSYDVIEEEDDVPYVDEPSTPRMDSMNDNDDASFREDDNPKKKNWFNLGKSKSPKPNESINWGISFYSKNTDEETQLSRHRKRRHDFYFKFLTRCTILLGLDRGHATAFGPMLGRLLNPPPVPRELVLDGNENVEVVISDFEDVDGNFQDKQEQKIKQTSLEHLQNYNDAQLLQLLSPFLDSLTLGSGYKCISLLLLHHLLTCVDGYDSRVRYALKQLSVILLSHEMKASYSWYTVGDLHELATRKFEALEHSIAFRLLSAIPTGEKKNNIMVKASEQEKNMNQNLIRGLKIGGAGVVAGTIFALTGGLAAPAIATGLAAISSTVAATAAFATLTSTTVITAIFGVGGGGLAAYKMQRRTKGLTEFNFQKESYSIKNCAELHSIICISGWLKDRNDYQRPWGVKPTKPPISSLTELLERFYFVHRPENVSRCGKILSQWKGQERELWKILRIKYGRDPDHLFPLTGGPREYAALNEEENEILNGFLDGLGFTVKKSKEVRKEEVKKKESVEVTDAKKHDIQDVLLQQIHETQQHKPDLGTDKPKSLPTTPSKEESNPLPEPPSHLLTVWDFQSQYSGELYTVKWESDLLLELCDSVTDLVVDLVGKGTREILRHTAVATLLTAIAIPAAMVGVTNAIDETWGLAITRAEEAGIELANCLLENQAGHRPVTLLGFSMGARIIYTCLKELARHQEIWEDLSDDVEEQIKQYSREPASIVEDVILMGLPNHYSTRSWKSMRRIISGRLINCYSKNDFILKFLFNFKRMSGILRPVCGTIPIELPGVENYDVTNFITSHSDYCLAVNDILDLVKFGQARISANIEKVVDGNGGERESKTSYSF